MMKSNLFGTLLLTLFLISPVTHALSQKECDGILQKYLQERAHTPSKVPEKQQAFKDLIRDHEALNSEFLKKSTQIRAKETKNTPIALEQIKQFNLRIAELEARMAKPQPKTTEEWEELKRETPQLRSDLEKLKTEKEDLEQVVEAKRKKAQESVDIAKSKMENEIRISTAHVILQKTQGGFLSSESNQALKCARQSLSAASPQHVIPLDSAHRAHKRIESDRISKDSISTESDSSPESSTKTSESESAK